MLTPKQKKTLEFIRSFTQKYGHPPTLENIARQFKLASKSTAQHYTNKLIEAGYLHKHKNGRFELLNEQEVSGEQIPLLGYISAGYPLEQPPDLNEQITLNERMDMKKCYALKVKGNSMIEDHILDGDILIIEKRSTATNGQTVVALIDNYESTLKKIYYAKDNKISLVPANPDFKPMEFEPERVTIQGIIKKIIRNY